MSLRRGRLFHQDVAVIAAGLIPYVVDGTAAGADADGIVFDSRLVKVVVGTRQTSKLKEFAGPDEGGGSSGAHVLFLFVIVIVIVHRVD